METNLPNRGPSIVTSKDVKGLNAKMQVAAPAAATSATPLQGTLINGSVEQSPGLLERLHIPVDHLLHDRVDRDVGQRDAAAPHPRHFGSRPHGEREAEKQDWHRRRDAVAKIDGACQETQHLATLGE